VTGRSFASVRQGVKSTADRWARSSRALKKDDRPYGERLVELAKRHASEAFYGCDDPLEAAVFSVLVELIKEQEQAKQEKTERDVDP
jgi:hypothetical protein